jgi:hypothetical protein
MVCLLTGACSVPVDDSPGEIDRSGVEYGGGAPGHPRPANAHRPAVPSRCRRRSGASASTRNALHRSNAPAVRRASSPAMSRTARNRQFPFSSTTLFRAATRTASRLVSISLVNVRTTASASRRSLSTTRRPNRRSACDPRPRRSFQSRQIDRPSNPCKAVAATAPATTAILYSRHVGQRSQHPLAHCRGRRHHPGKHPHQLLTFSDAIRQIRTRPDKSDQPPSPGECDNRSVGTSSPTTRRIVKEPGSRSRPTKLQSW